jgi:predicted MFS family arabinose efflux permease
LSQENHAEFVLTKSLILLMAVICGVCVANLYYIQPLEAQVASEFRVSQGMAGIAATMTQVGYAVGLVFLVPLGDILERRDLILRMLVLVAASLLAAAISPSYGVFLPAMFAIGLTTIVPQLIVPFAAHLSRPEARGKVIGDVMSGLLIGILLSRAFSGLLGSGFGWRRVYLCAAGLMALMFLLVLLLFPKSRPVSDLSYAALLKSIPGLIRNQRPLRESAVNGFFLFGSFSIFWTSLVFLLETPLYRMGSREAGLFGFAGVAGALAAPLIGKMADRKSPRFPIGIAVLLSTLAYAVFALFGNRLWGLILGVVILDLGNQGGQVSNQARIHSLGDEARSRNNMIFMFSYFIGGATGSFLGTLSWQKFGWAGVCAVGFLFQAAALIFHFLVYRPRHPAAAA